LTMPIFASPATAPKCWANLCT